MRTAKVFRLRACLQYALFNLWALEWGLAGIQVYWTEAQSLFTYQNGSGGWLHAVPALVNVLLLFLFYQMQPRTNLQQCEHQRGEQTGLPGYSRNNTVCATVADMVHCNAVHIHMTVS